MPDPVKSKNRSQHEREGLLAALRRIPRKVWLRMLLLVAIVITGFVLVRFTPIGDYFTREYVVATFERLENWPWAPVLLILLYAVLAPLGFPMSPMVAAGSVVFKAFWGAIYNTLGLVIGAMTAFFVAQVLGREFIVQLAGPRLRRAERIFERRGFWPLVQARFLPLPFPVVSYGAAFAGVKASRFFITSAIGLLPATIMHTYFMARLYELGFSGEEPPAFFVDGSPSVFAKTLVIYICMWGTLIVVSGWPTFRETLRRRRRYQELMEQRRSR